MASSLGWFDLEFWWELAALVTIMLLGHWQEMKAIGQAQGALAALAELLPDEAERSMPTGRSRRSRSSELAVGDVVLVRPAGGSRPTGGSSTGEAELDESMITGESRPSPRRSATGSWPARWRPTRRSACEVEAVGDDTALPASNGWWPRRRRARAAPRCWPTASPRSCSTSPPARPSSPSSSGRCSATSSSAVEQHGDRARDRLPARARAGDPAGHRALDGRRRHSAASSSRTGSRSSGCGRSTPSSSTRPAR